jgi:hypothetical protein
VRATDEAGKYYRASEYCQEYTKREITGTYREIPEASYIYMTTEKEYPRDWDYELTHSLDVCPFCTQVFGGITGGNSGGGNSGGTTTPNAHDVIEASSINTITSVVLPSYSWSFNSCLYKRR